MNEKLEFTIRENYSSLRKSEKKAADYLLSYQGDGRELTLELFADGAGVSQPTVLRFIRALGYQGFKDFRYELVREEDRTEKGYFLYGSSISKDDKIAELPAKLIGTAVGQLKDTLKNLSADNLEKAVRAITGARNIAVFYVENSSCTASDLVTKLTYLGFSCCSYSDYYLQNVSAGNLTKEDVAIGISYSGCSISTVDAMRIAKKAGARTIAITNFENTLLEKYADIVLITSGQHFIYGDAIFSRVSQLAVVDMIYTGILLSDYEKYTAILDRSSNTIRKQAYDANPSEK
ncbi:MAG TPA: MurR/RpiR family transcriptional regulator [Candidatus Anaerobutyricum stercoris]|uniref:MurR/RpiR family transcriptional regulator n=1 Tax=Candidatus Anaerobutyricum stercoris TaxID=2838457 RepID=A0A9D2J6M2_9FIRM|nr:MurR/RpiR family transcriptional regulator [Candidatus Anaerobutyricum stercoris]